MGMTSLVMTFKAPLQSYGDVTTFGYRTTWLHPSKSAVIGMLMSALGKDRDDDSALSRLNKLDFAVRVDQAGSLITDFRNVHYQKVTNSQFSKIRYQDDGNKISYVDYLMDAVFTIAIGGDEATLQELQYALRHPVWALYYGRRSNPVGIIPTEIVDADPVTTLKQANWHATKTYRRKIKADNVTLPIFFDQRLVPDRPHQLRKDVALSQRFTHRQFTYRPEAMISVKISTESNA